MAKHQRIRKAKLTWRISSIVLLTTIFGACICLYGCQTADDAPVRPPIVDQGITNTPKDHYLDKDEIDEWVRSRYFYENGEAKRYFWENSAAAYYNNPYHYEYEEVTDYEITFIKNIYEENTVFLVEFEPSGFIYGTRNLRFYSFLYHHPSPFKLLDIPKEDRYYVGDKLAARRGEYIVNIEEEAYVGRVYPAPEGYERETYVWDYEKNWWILFTETAD